MYEVDNIPTSLYKKLLMKCFTYFSAVEIATRNEWANPIFNTVRERIAEEIDRVDYEDPDDEAEIEWGLFVYPMLMDVGDKLTRLGEARAAEVLANLPEICEKFIIHFLVTNLIKELQSKV